MAEHACREKRSDGAMSPNAKKVLIVGVVALVLFFLISQPTESANAVKDFLGWLQDGAEGIITFFKELFN
jgi:hypothetical protein